MPAANARPGTRLRELGISLPIPPVPLGGYVEASQAGSLLFMSGVLPVVNGKLGITGRIGENVTAEQAREAVRLAALNSLSAAHDYLGDLDRIKKLVRLSVTLVTTDDFTQHAVVADGASELFLQIFGRENGHARTVFGARTLPASTPLVVELLFEID